MDTDNPAARQFATEKSQPVLRTGTTVDSITVAATAIPISQMSAADPKLSDLTEDCPVKPDGPSMAHAGEDGPGNTTQETTKQTMATTDQETLQTFDLNLGHFQRVKPTLSLTTKTTLKPSPRPDTYTVYETDFNLRSTFPKVITTGEIPYFMHGISDDTGEPYTIAIFAFHMAPRGVNWRIREVHIEAAFEFIKEDPNEYASHPEIIAYSPKYTSFYNLSEHKESDSSEWSAVPSVTTPGWSISVPGWKRQILAHDIPVKDYVRVNGTRPEPYTVEWDVLENKTTRSGVPPFFRTAVHLRRRPEDAHRPFTCTMKLRAKINKRRKLGWESRWKAMGGTPPEKPIIFDPRRRDNPGKLDQHRHKISGFRIEDWSAVAPYWVAEDVRMEMKRKM